MLFHIEYWNNGGAPADLGDTSKEEAEEPAAVHTAAPEQHSDTTGASWEEAYYKGMALLERGEYQEAIAQFERAMAEGGETAELYLQRGMACHEWQYCEGRCSYQEALADYDQAIDLDPDNAYAHAQRAWTLAGWGTGAGARRLYEGHRGVPRGGRFLWWSGVVPLGAGRP